MIFVIFVMLNFEFFNNIIFCNIEICLIEYNLWFVYLFVFVGFKILSLL